MNVAIDPKHVPANRRNESPLTLGGSSPGGAYQRLLSALTMPSNRQAALKAVGITSVSSGEGVSTVSRGLAETAAAQGLGDSLLIDLSGKSAPASDADTSLIDAISGRVEVAAAITQSSCPGLMLCSAGGQPIDSLNPDEVHHLGKLLADLRQQFELIVVDLPSFTDSSAVTRLGGFLDGMVLVVQAEKVPGKSAQRVLQELRHCGVNVVGAVLTKQREYLPRWLRRRMRHGDGHDHSDNRSGR